jgi:hypothetical protein
MGDAMARRQLQPPCPAHEAHPRAGLSLPSPAVQPPGPRHAPPPGMAETRGSSCCGPLQGLAHLQWADAQYGTCSVEHMATAHSCAGGQSCKQCGRRWQQLPSPSYQMPGLLPLRAQPLQLLLLHRRQPSQCASQRQQSHPQAMLPTSLGRGMRRQGPILVHVCNVAGAPGAV